MAKLQDPLIYQLSVSTGTKPRNILVLSKKPLKAKEITIASDVEISVQGSFFTNAEVVTKTGTTDTKTSNAAVINGDLSFIAYGLNDYFELSNDPYIEVINDSGSTANVMIKIIPMSEF